MLLVIRVPQNPVSGLERRQRGETQIAKVRRQKQADAKNSELLRAGSLRNVAICQSIQPKPTRSSMLRAPFLTLKIQALVPGLEGRVRQCLKERHLRPSVSVAARTVRPLAARIPLTAPKRPRSFNPERMMSVYSRNAAHVAASLNRTSRFFTLRPSSPSSICAGELFLALRLATSA